MPSKSSQIPKLVRDLYKLVTKFTLLYPERSFTPDGHLVGSIGEVVAAAKYDLTLLSASTVAHDATAPDGKFVQVKVTQGKTVALRAEPKHLIVLQLLRSGKTQEVYNGRGSRAWRVCGKMQKNGQRPISISKLQTLMKTVPDSERLPST